MTRFNPKNKKQLTYGESLGPAMEIADQADADQYFKDYVTFIQKFLDKEPRTDRKTAEQIAKSNLGYYAGYYDNETRLRVEHLFHCTHPILGKATQREVSPEKAFYLGKKLGEQMKEKEAATQ